jgi:phosphopantothenoylcysteine synthetase/decarboxylase
MLQAFQQPLHVLRRLTQQNIVKQGATQNYIKNESDMEITVILELSKCLFQDPECIFDDCLALTQLLIKQTRVVTATDGQTRPSIRPSRSIRFLSADKGQRHVDL